MIRSRESCVELSLSLSLIDAVVSSYVFICSVFSFIITLTVCGFSQWWALCSNEVNRPPRFACLLVVQSTALIALEK